MTGLQVQQELARRGVRLTVILLSGSIDAAVVAAIGATGAVEFLDKPVDGERLLAMVQRALALDRRRRPG